MQSKEDALSVSELTQQIKFTLESNHRDIWIKGEVSNFKPASSGHLYFSLKDEEANLSAALFGYSKKSQQLNLKDGSQVLCHGKISVFPPRGSYQLVVDHIELLGEGSLLQAFEKLKKKLLEEGLFELQRKKKIPSHPHKVAVITSPTGAAVQDILTVLKRRAPQLEVIVIPALVQGEEAPRHLIRGLEAVNKWKLAEVIIIGRGGGSLEDLWCFNDEKLARAIAASEIPVISAVGHEVDFTISDFVSDLRAPTPSAAAELVSQSWFLLRDQILSLQQRIEMIVKKDLYQKKLLLQHLSARIINPKDKLREQMQKMDDLTQRMERALKNRLTQVKLKIDQTQRQLEALSPLRVLERGYSLVLTETGALIQSSGQLHKDQKILIQMKDGKSHAQITG